MRELTITHTESHKGVKAITAIYFRIMSVILKARFMSLTTLTKINKRNQILRAEASARPMEEDGGFFLS